MGFDIFRHKALSSICNHYNFWLNLFAKNRELILSPLLTISAKNNYQNIMASNNNGKSETTVKNLLNTGVSLFQNRLEYRATQYKTIGIEKGSKLAATVIISVIQILALGLFWLFANLSLSYWLSFSIFDSYAKGFGAVALGHLAVVLLGLILARPLKGLIEYNLAKKLK